MYNIKNYFEINYSKYLFIPTNPNSDYAQIYGGLASAITCGNFLEGAAIGLVVTALNHALHEALDPDPTQQQKQKSEHVLQYEKENGVELFSTMDEAAIDWGMKNNDNSIADNLEYNSDIYSVKIKGKSWYAYTQPNPGTSDISSPLPIPKGTKIAGNIHSHGSYGNDDAWKKYSNKDFFSSSSKRYNNTPQYLARPDGTLLKFIYRSDYYIYNKNGAYPNPRKIYTNLPFQKN